MKTIRRAAMAAAAGLAALALAAGTAQAAPLPAGGMTLEDAQAWLKSGGLDATIDASINAVIVKGGDQTLVVFLADCKDSRCASLQYFYGIRFDGGLTADDASTAVIMNRWNRSHRWLRGYADPSRNVVVEMDVQISPGLDTNGLNESIRTFIGGIGVFQQYLRTVKAGG